MRAIRAKVSCDSDRKLLEQNKQLADLLSLEAQVRRQKTELALSLWVVNELRAVIDYSQCILFRFTRNGKARATAISSISSVDRNAPFVRWIEKQIETVFKRAASASGQGDHDSDVIDIDLCRPGENSDNTDEIYPFVQGFVVPLRDMDGKVFGGLFMARGRPWTMNEKTVAARLSGSVAHGFCALLPKRKLRRLTVSGWVISAIFLVALIAMFIPVPMTVLAPAEIVADNPHIVAAPISGVLWKIYPDANVQVDENEVLFEFDNTELKAAADVARRKELVAAARLATAKQAAFSDPQVYRQLAIAKADVDLARAERLFADRKLARTIVRAQKSGQLIYSDRREWTGKPVKTGERIMEIADTGKVIVKIDLPVGDAINLERGAKVRLFLDSNPLAPLSGSLRKASYHAQDRPGVGLVYEVIADLAEGKKSVVPRIGLRGTAQIYGEKVLLGYYLFRKPISSLRQYFGF